MTTLSERPAPHATTDAGPAPLLSGRDVRKSFQAGRSVVEILHGIDLDLVPGETCAVMGPSGSGKSTLLACLAGLERPTSGTVQLLGRDVAGQSSAALARARRSEVGFIFQSYNLLPALTGLENVALPFRLARRRPPVDRIQQVMKALAIEHLVDQRPPSMSGGEQQRVAIARVLVQGPRVLFADEPTGALDTASGERVLELLVAQAHEGDPTGADQALLMVTHDPTVAARCDRVVMLRDGRVVDELHDPTTEQVTSSLAAHSASSAA